MNVMEKCSLELQM